MDKLVSMDQGDAFVGMLTGVVAACITGLMIGELGGAIGAVVAFIAARERHGRRARLQRRIDSPLDLEWGVVINHVRVGTLSDASYAGLEKAVLEDWRVLWHQAANFGKVGVRAAEMLIFAIPVTLFWLCLAIVLLDPEAAGSVVAAMRAAPPEELFAAARLYANVAILAAIVVMCFLAMMASPRLGYENKYQATLADAVRRQVHASAEGRMMLVPAPVPAKAAAA